MCPQEAAEAASYAKTNTHETKAERHVRKGGEKKRRNAATSRFSSLFWCGKRRKQKSKTPVFHVNEKGGRKANKVERRLH